MRIYAVLDLKAGQVMHAVAGQRDRYRPIRSDLVASSAPGDVARALIERWGIRDAYVADLDAIGGETPDIGALQSIADAGLRLIVDVGVHTLSQADWLLDRMPQGDQLRGLIVPLESSHAPCQWLSLVERIGVRRAIFSLDLQSGRPLTPSTQLAKSAPLEIARQAWHAGFRRLIVLDLQAVGSRQGPATLELCCALSQQVDWSELITGGGVRGQRDLDLLEQAGCHSVLLATALHIPSDGDTFGPFVRCG